MFIVRQSLYGGYSDAAMHPAAAHGRAILSVEDIGQGYPWQDSSSFTMTTESLSRDYPLYSTSLLNLIKTSETLVDKEK